LPLRPVIFSLTERKPEAKQAFIEPTCIGRKRLLQARPSASVCCCGRFLSVLWWLKTGAKIAPSGAMFDGTYAMLLLSQYSAQYRHDDGLKRPRLFLVCAHFVSASSHFSEATRQ
jgi:hypothetical protein